MHRCFFLNFFLVFGFTFILFLVFWFFVSVLMFGVQAQKMIREPSSTAVIEMAATTVANTFLSILC